MHTCTHAHMCTQQEFLGGREPDLPGTSVPRRLQLEKELLVALGQDTQRRSQGLAVEVGVIETSLQRVENI